MEIFGVIQPGSRIVIEEVYEAANFELLLSLLTDFFYEATLSLALFNKALSEKAFSTDISRRWMNEVRQRDIELHTMQPEQLPERLQDITIKLRFESGCWVTDREGDIRIRTEAEREVFQKLYQEGHIPFWLAFREQFLHAKSFLYSVDGFRKLLRVISVEPGFPSANALLLIADEFDVAFPGLAMIRNTAQHLEDRARGLGAGSKPKPLVPRPDDTKVNPNGAINNLLMLNVFRGTHYGNTLADGYYGEIDISADSMRKLQAIYQKILDALPWEGYPCLIPQY